MDPGANALSKKGRNKLRIDMTNNTGAEGTGLNIPQ
jgi:hypothetical protein